MDYTRAHQFVVLTHDLDLGSVLAATKGAKPSVVQIRSERVSPALIGDQVGLGLRQMASELEDGALLSIDLKRARMRLLPLRG